MYVHTFEVTVPDGSTVYTQSFVVVTAERVVRVRHRVTEIDPPPREPDEGPPWGMAPEDWDDFSLDEDG